jgi:hypothetical protein
LIFSATSLPAPERFPFWPKRSSPKKMKRPPSTATAAKVMKAASCYDGDDADEEGADPVTDCSVDEPTECKG